MKAPEKVGGGSPYTYGWDPPDQEWLKYQHVTLGKSAKLIVKELRTTRSVVLRWFRQLGVERVNAMKSLETEGAPRRRPDGYYWNPPSKEWLELHYVHLDKTGREIAAEVGATRPTVISWLRSAGIPIRPANCRAGQSERCFRERARALLEKISPQFCEMCERGPEERQIEVHHIDGNPYNNKLYNLQWLCRGCHTILHRRGGD